MKKDKNNNILLKLENIKKYFPVQKSFLDQIFAGKLDYVRAVDDVSFHIKRGEAFGLAGESGSGKTTILRKLCNAFNSVRRTNISLPGPVSSMVSEEPDDQLMFRKVADEFHLVQYDDVPTVDSSKFIALKRLGGVDVEVPTLSWGFRRLLTLLLSVLRLPEILILDEPEAGLDCNTMIIIRSLLKEAMSHGCAIVIAVNKKGILWNESDYKTKLEKNEVGSKLDEY